MKRAPPPRIAVIGAASSSSFSGLLADQDSADDLNGAALAVVGIDAGGLQIMAAGMPLRVSGSPNRGPM